MHRIDGAGATVDNKFTQGNPATATPATTVTDAWLNDVQEEIAAVPVAVGIPLVKGQLQLLPALGKLSGRVVDTIAALKALDKTKFTRACTWGYDAAGDGGNAEYWMDAADTTSADNGVSVIVANDGGRWKLVHGGTLLAMQCGVKGDGTAGDTAALQKAIDYCNNTGYTLDLGGRVCRLNAHLDLKGGYILRNGALFLPADIDLTGAPAFGGATRAVYSQNSTGLLVDEVEFYSVKVGLTKFVSVATIGCNNIAFRRCVFRDFGDATYYVQGLVIFGGSGIELDGCAFANCSGDGGAIAEGATQIRFANNVCQNNGDWGFAFSNNCSNGIVIGNLFLTNTSTATGCDECVDFVFSGNIAVQNEHGIRIARFGATTTPQRDIVISGNELRANGIGIEVAGCDSPSQVSITGNSVKASTAQGINIVDTAGFVVSGNIIQGSGAEGVMMISYNASKPVGNGVVSGNLIDGCTYGVRQLASGGALSDVAVSANRVANSTVARYAGIQGHYVTDESDYFSMSKAIGVPTALTSGAATQGGIASPGNFAGFLDIYVDGTKKKVPYFNS